MPGAITSKSLRDYWCNRYRYNFHTEYPKRDYAKDCSMLKRIFEKYNKNHYLIMAAIDHFLSSCDKSHATINYFSSDSVFSSKFARLIRSAPILEYRAHVKYVSQSEIGKFLALICEYEDYCDTETIADDEKLRRRFILNELAEMRKKMTAIKPAAVNSLEIASSILRK